MLLYMYHSSVRSKSKKVVNSFSLAIFEAVKVDAKTSKIPVTN